MYIYIYIYIYIVNVMFDDDLAHESLEYQSLGIGLVLHK